MDFLHVRLEEFAPRNSAAADGLPIAEAFQAEFVLRSGDFSLIPNGLACPSIGSEDFSVFELNPGMVADGAVDAEKLDVSKRPTQLSQEMKAFIRVLRRIGQAVADYQNPALDRR